MRYIILTLLIVVSGCTFKAEPSDLDFDGRLTNCVDTRDGETFSIIRDREHIFNTRIGLNGIGYATIIDTDGRERSITSAMDSYLKCTVVERKL